jgi:hypothetical protein
VQLQSQLRQVVLAKQYFALVSSSASATAVETLASYLADPVHASPHSSQRVPDRYVTILEVLDIFSKLWDLEQRDYSVRLLSPTMRIIRINIQSSENLAEVSR